MQNLLGLRSSRLHLESPSPFLLFLFPPNRSYLFTKKGGGLTFGVPPPYGTTCNYAFILHTSMQVVNTHHVTMFKSLLSSSLNGRTPPPLPLHFSFPNSKSYLILSQSSKKLSLIPSQKLSEVCASKVFSSKIINFVS